MFIPRFVPSELLIPRRQIIRLELNWECFRWGSIAQKLFLFRMIALIRRVYKMRFFKKSLNLAYLISVRQSLLQSVVSRIGWSKPVGPLHPECMVGPAKPAPARASLDVRKTRLSRCLLSVPLPAAFGERHFCQVVSVWDWR